MRYDLTDLRLLLAVIDAGSITHGASAIGLSLAAASERLRDMEAEAGLQLVERQRHGVVPTAAGDGVAEHARRILAQMAALQETLAGHAEGRRTRLRIAVNTAAMSAHLPEPLARFLAANPLVDVALLERQSADVARAVRLGLVDFGILSDAVNVSDLALAPFAIDRLVAVMRRGHALAGMESLNFSQVAGAPAICLSGGALQAHLDEQARLLGTRIEARATAADFAALCRMAALGAGIGIVPQTAAERSAADADGAAFVPLSDPWATRRLVLACRADTPLSGVAERLARSLAPA